MAGPWEAYQRQPATDGPWNAYRPKAEPEKAPNPTDGMSGYEKFMAGTGKAFVDLYRGAQQLVGVGDQAEIDAAKERDKALMGTGAGVAGNVVGNVAASLVPAAAAAVAAPAAAAIAPAAATAARAFAAAHPAVAAIAPGVASGGLMGALEPTATGESRAGNIALGAGVGGAAAALPRAVARVVRPNTSDDAAQLIREGVRLTPGQAMGGVARRLEDKAESLPIVGDMISRAKGRATEDFNRAAFNRVLAPIGEKADKAFPVGREGVGLLERTVGKAYDRALAKIGRVDLDDTFRAEVGQITAMTDELVEGSQAQFRNIVQRRVMDRMTPAGTMSADTMKVVESDLGRLASQFSSGADQNQRQLGAALREVQASLRRAVERTAGPEGAADLKAANKAWSEFVRVQDAAARVGKEGVFSPAQFEGAVKKADKSVRKGKFAKGEAVGQDLADAGRAVMSPTVGNSGTADRLLPYGAAAALFADPVATTTLGALGSLAYTAPAQRAALALLAQRPESARTLAELLRAGSPAAGVVGAAMGVPSLTGP